MPFLNSRFWADDLPMNRIVYIGGVYGSGKTLLSVAIAETLWRRGYRVYANFPLAFNSDIRPEDAYNLHKAVIVLDEAGARLLDARAWNSKDSRDLLSVMDYARKQDLYFILPTATTVDKRARKLVIARNLRARRFFVTAGLDRLLWHYVVMPCQDQRFSAFLAFPYAYFGVYDTKAIPGAYEDALAFLMFEFQKRVAVDAEKTRQALEDMKARLDAGEVIPGLRVGDSGSREA